MRPPGIPELPKSNESNVRPPFQGVCHPHFEGTANEIHSKLIHQLSFPYIGDPAEFIQLKSLVKMDRLRMHHFHITQFKAPSFIRFDGPYATPAVISRDLVPVGAALSRTDKIYGPAIQVNTVD